MTYFLGDKETLPGSGWRHLNSEKRVRLIGVNTPESVHPDETKNSESGKAASEYTKELLANHTDVWLQQDVSETDTRNVEEVKNKMLNGNSFEG